MNTLVCVKPKKTMREKLLKLLRHTEKQYGPRDTATDYFKDDYPELSEEEFLKFIKSSDRKNFIKNEYVEYNDEYQCYYSVEEYLDFPNYRFIVRELNNKYQDSTNNDATLTYSRNGILAELKRMEADGLIMIDVQDGEVYATTSGTKGPDFEDGHKITCENIILTTKGKSGYEYLFYQIEEQRFAVFALILSVISISISLVH
ncbi:MAG: hypothetical protein WAX85_00325 [Minisyncoccia bacterium]